MSIPTTSRAPSVVATPAPEVLRRLELTITRRLDGMLQGDYRGLVPGHGTELGETREYSPGDDVRRIDWNVTARTVVPHVREAIADRELETWALLDTSASLGFGTASCQKRDLSLAALAALGFLTARGGNRLGALVLRAGGVEVIPARAGRGSLQALLRRAHTGLAAAEGRTDLAAGAERLLRTMRRRGLAVIASDFLDPGDWQRPLRALGAHHETLAIEVVDPRELALPDVGLVELVDPETGARVEVQTADRRVRERFEAAAAAQREDTARRIRAAGADHLVLRTDRDWLVDLARFVTWRRERIDALARARP